MRASDQRIAARPEIPMRASAFAKVSADTTEYITLGDAAKLAPGRPRGWVHCFGGWVASENKA